MMSKPKRSVAVCVFFASIFVFMFVWFTAVHPLVVLDGDDWTYIGWTRRALPLWGIWNPSKILPEILMPLCGSISSFVVYPITGDYLFSITLVSAAIVSGFILLYTVTFYGLLKIKGGVESPTACWLTLLFLIFHFLIFRSANGNNIYMFHSGNLNCYYNYLIPAMLNASIVFFLESNRKMNKAVLFVAVYLAIFSNVVSSIILASYAGCVIVYDYIFGNTKEVVPFVGKHKRDILIIVLWCVSAVYELSGGRASAVSTDTSYVNSVFTSVKGILVTVYNANRTFIIVAVITFMAALLVGIKLYKKGIKSNISREILLFFSAMVINFLYIILLRAKLGYYTEQLSTYLFACVMFGFLVIIFCIAYVIEQNKKIISIIPLCTIILLFEINTTGQTFQESNSAHISSKEAFSISNDVLNQILTAAEEQKEEMDLFVPKYDTDDNWPLPNNVGERISYTLYEHGLVDYKINVTVVPYDLDEE